MRRSFVRSAALVAALGSFGFAAACVDLFHGTSFDTLCEIDASAPECGGDGAPVTTADGASMPATTSDAATALPLDICTLDVTSANAAADHACAWLGACAGAFGGNTASACLLHARETLDCKVAPSRPARGALLAVWRCLASAQSCTDVGACIEPGGTEQCPLTDAGAFVACAVASAGSAGNASVRIACSGTTEAPTAIESCATGGQTCALFASGASCGGGGTSRASGTTSATCAASGGTSCDGTKLHDCDGAGTDRGLDCANVGSGACVPGTSGVAASCAAVSADGAGAVTRCTPTDAVTCDDAGGAHGCPSGTSETVDCASLVGSPSCNANAGGAAYDVARACGVATTSCNEGCENGVVTACLGGVATSLDCKAQGLSGCSFTQVGDATHPACTN